MRRHLYAAWHHIHFDSLNFKCKENPNTISTKLLVLFCLESRNASPVYHVEILHSLTLLWQITENLRDTCPYKVRGLSYTGRLMNGSKDTVPTNIYMNNFSTWPGNWPANRTHHRCTLKTPVQYSTRSHRVMVQS